MKTLMLITLITFITVAQEKTYFDSPFGAGGGYMPGWMFVNMDELNTQLAGFGSGELSKSGFYAGGGVGYAYIPFIPFVRVGGLGFGGVTKSSGVVGTEKREVEYSNAFGGFTMEYTFPFVRSFGISAGVILGGGSSKIEFSKTSGTYDWNNLWTEINSGAGTNRYSRRVASDYFLLAPTLNIDIPVYRLFSIRVGGGYSLALGGEWKADGDVEVYNVPDKLKGGGAFVNAGLLFGFFAY